MTSPVRSSRPSERSLDPPDFRRPLARDFPPDSEENGPFEEEREEEEEDLRRAMEIVNFTGYSGTCQREEREGAPAAGVEQWSNGVMDLRLRGS